MLPISAIYTSDSGIVTVSNNAPVIVIQPTEWMLLYMKLEGTAGGVNSLLLGSGPNGMVVEAGDIIPALLVAPGSNVRVSTTFGGMVTWSWIATQLPGNMLINLLVSATSNIGSGNAGYLDISGLR